MLVSRGNAVDVKPAGRNIALTLNDAKTVYFILTRCVRGRWGGDRWRIRLDKKALSGAALVARMDSSNTSIAAYYLFPDLKVLRNQPEMKSRDLSAIEPHRIASLVDLLPLV